MLASLDGNLLTGFAFGALHSQDDLLGGLGLLTQDGLRLTSEALLFSVVTTTSLGSAGFLALLVLGHFVEGVLFALALAVCSSGFRNVDHFGVEDTQKESNKANSAWKS